MQTTIGLIGLDTQRRMEALEGSGILYVGSGVSGGEEGALRGPALMPGGSLEAWPLVRPFLQPIAANLLQAQRDYFGAHTYQRLDRPGKFHTQWPKAPQT